MDYKYIFFTLLISQYTIQSSPLFEIPLTKTAKGEFLLYFNVGYPPQKLQLKLLTSTTMLWIANKNYYHHGYNPFSSQTKHQITTPYHLKYKKQDITCALIEETISLHSSNQKELTAEKVMIYLAEKGKIDNDFDGVIGFGLGGENDKAQQFLNILKLNNQIDMRIYLITKDKLIIGSGVYTLIDNNNKKRVKYCDCIENRDHSNRKYNCKVELMYLTYDDNNNNIEYTQVDEDKNEIVFKIGANVLLVPYNYFVFIKNKLFMTYIDIGICNSLNEGNLNYIACSSSNSKIKDIKTDINIVIGKWTMKLNLAKLFIPSSEAKFTLFNIMSEQSKENENLWVIGSAILNQYNIIFDNENKKVGIIKNYKFQK